MTPRRLVAFLVVFAFISVWSFPCAAADDVDAKQRALQKWEAEVKRLQDLVNKAKEDDEAQRKAAEEACFKVFAPDECAKVKNAWSSILDLTVKGLTLYEMGPVLGFVFLAKMWGSGKALEALQITPQETEDLRTQRLVLQAKKVDLAGAEKDVADAEAEQTRCTECKKDKKTVASAVESLLGKPGAPGTAAVPSGGYLKVELPDDQYVQVNTDVDFFVNVQGGTKPYQLHVASGAFPDIDAMLDDASKGSFKRTLRFSQEGVYPVTVTVSDDAIPRQTEGKTVVYNVRTDPVPPKPVPPTGKPLTVGVPKDQAVDLNTDIPFHVDVSDGAPPYEIHVRSSAFTDIDLRLDKTGAVEPAVKFPREGNYSILVDVSDSAGQTKSATVVFTARLGSGQIAEISIDPDRVTLKAGETRQFRALGLFGDRSQTPKDVTAQATWEGLEPDHTFKAASAGTYTVAATYQGVRGQTIVTVTKPEPVTPPAQLTLKIDPDAVTLEIGETKQLRVVGTYSDRPGQTEDLSDVATWTGVGPDRTFRAEKAGTYPITALHKGVGAQARITVTPAAAPTRPPFTARLECGGLVEVVPGEVSKPCGVIVEGWRSDTTEPVEIEVVWPRQASGVEVFPGNTRSEPGSMFNPGVKTSGVDRYVFSEGFSARDTAPPGRTNVTIRVRQRGAGEIELSLAAVVVSKSGKPTGPLGATAPGVSGGASGRLSAELDCGDSFELAPGDVVGRTCGIVVRGWRSDIATPVEVEVVWPRASSGVDVTPGSTSADATVMYSAGVSDTADRYVFSEGFTARPDAPPGTTTVDITVRQRDVGSVPLRVNVSVLRKGLLPGSGPGTRPPPTVAGGTGGEFCVWRYKLFGDKPACFHFVAAECTTARYNTPGSSYEMVGQNMKWSEADARIQQLSTYFDDNYGCNVAGGTTPTPTTTKPSDPGPDTPVEKLPEKPPEEGPQPPAPTGPVLSRFGVMCSPAEVTLGDSPGSTPSVRCQAFGVYSDKPDTTLEVTSRAAWSQGPTFTPDAPGSLVVQASLEGASESATVTVKSGYSAATDPRAGGTGHAGPPILPPDGPPPGGLQSDPNTPPKGGLGGGPVVALTPPDSKNPNSGETGPNSGPGTPGGPGQPQPCWNAQAQRWDLCPPAQGIPGSPPTQPGGRGGKGSEPGRGTPPTTPGGTGTKPTPPPIAQPPSTLPPTTQPPPKAPPTPLPPTAAAAGAKCDQPLCREMCAMNCNATNDIGFVKSCADTCKPMSACPKPTYKLAEVKAACYDNILTRCKQGQAGWGGDWCVGPGADKTCEARAQQICKCGDKPACRGNWGSLKDDGPRWFAGDAEVASDVACTVPLSEQEEPSIGDAVGLVGPDAENGARAPRRISAAARIAGAILVSQ